MRKNFGLARYDVAPRSGSLPWWEFVFDIRHRSGLDILSLDETGQERVKQLVLAQADVFESQGKLRLPPEPLRGVQQVAGILRRATQF